MQSNRRVVKYDLMFTQARKINGQRDSLEGLKQVQQMHIAYVKVLHFFNSGGFAVVGWNCTRHT